MSAGVQKPELHAGVVPPRADGEAGAQAAWDAEASAPIALFDAIAIARRCTEDLTGLPADGISASGRQADGSWRIVVEVIEGAARLGDNDLLSIYEVLLACHGELTGFSRLGRYRRENDVAS